MEAKVEETEFSGKEFIACINCLKVIPLIPEEVKEEIELEMPGVFVEEDDFMAKHKGKGHKIVNLWVVNFFSEQLYLEPIKVGWYQTQSKKGEKFIVKKSRTKIEEPFTFELFRGRIKTSTEDIALQEENIIKQLKWERPELSKEKLQEISETLRGVFEIERESIFDKINRQFSFLEKNGFLATTDHPLRFLLGLDPMSVMLLKRSLRPICNVEEQAFMSDFIDKNRTSGGILAIQVKIRFRPVIFTKIDCKKS